MNFGTLLVIVFGLLPFSVITGSQTRYINLGVLDNHTCTGVDVVMTSLNITRLRCSLMCENEARCTGFTYCDDNRGCNLCQGGNMKLTSSSDEMKYFVEETRIWGRSCQTMADCQGENQQCIEGLCVCSPGYSFLKTAWTCTEVCATYGNTFQRYIGHRINGNNMYSELGVSLSTCLDTCRANPVCVSIDYSADHMSTTKCNYQNLTVHNVPNSYVAIANFDYYNRNCQ